MPDETQEGQGLDDKSLFAGATAPDPAAAETPPPETPPAETKPPETPPTGEKPPEEQIPSWRLREEAEARRRAEERVNALEGQLRDIAARLGGQQPPAEKKQVSFYENPEEAISTMIVEAVSPFAEQTRKSLDVVSRMIANQAHTKKIVDEAEAAFIKAAEDRTLDPADWHRVGASANRYDEVVSWHKRQKTLAAVGDDPDAFFTNKLAERLKDATFAGELLEKIRGVAAANGQGQSFQMPPSLSRQPSAAGNKESLGDMSDASLFAFARSK